MADRIMTHLVAFYPDRDRSLEVARALTDGGAAYLEVQFPFSEPTADGPVIQRACAQALERGFSVDEGFRLLDGIRGFATVPVFVMSYANIAYRAGVQRFVQRCRDAGASGIIVPDLPPDSDEGLYAAAAAAGLDAIPVVAPTITDARLGLLKALRVTFLYAALRKGITGAATEIGKENIDFLSRLGPVGAKILAGFGISQRSQIKALAPHVHACIVGSALIEATAAAGGDSPYTAVRARLESLL
jgi:tryptophan synthase alpha chain